MADFSGKALVAKVEKIWSASGAWPEFIQTLRQALFSGESSSDGSGISRLAFLPGMCCQAAGGQAAWADDLSLAWLLFYTAAQLMDSVQDNDEPDSWWREAGPGVALNAASGLFFTAASALHHLSELPIPPNAAQDIYTGFYNGFLVMCAGQYADLTRPEPTLDQYWEQAAAKSGAFFALACRCGARLATSDPETLDAYGEMGLHLGLLVQMRDDLDDVLPPSSKATFGQRAQLTHSLPYLYALQMLPYDQQEQLRRSGRSARKNPRAARKTLELIDRSGAALYIRVEMRRHTGLARQALQNAQPRSPAAGMLDGFIDTLG